MKIRFLLHNLPVSLFILRSASVLVPGQQREEWLAEWKAELWQVCRARSVEPSRSFHGHEDVTAFCLGAFQDAFWLRWNYPRAGLSSVLSHTFRLGSATRCGLSLGFLAAASLVLCFCLPGARRVLLSSPYRNAGGLVTISGGGYAGIQSPTIRLSDYRAWKMNTHHLFTELAFYQPVVQRVHIARHQTATLSIASASANLFELLNVPVSAGWPATPDHPNTARLVLSRRTWQKSFHGDPHIFGRVVEIAGRPVVISGVIADDLWRLPGQVDAWALEDEHALSSLPSGSKGYVVAQVATGFQAGPGGRRSMTVTRKGRDADRFDCISMAQRARQPFSIFLFTLLLACLALPATTPLPLGDYPARANELPRSIRARRWIFLVLKCALILPIVYFCSVDLAYSGCPLGSTTSIYIQFATSFLGFLFAFRWSLQDQRKRCPMCLRLLSNPARVGQASRNFLAWNGTELICTEGHGLLHIPEIQTSWLSAQRWLYLDPSWRSLFSDVYIPSAGVV
jgi:hypothetical protein